MRGCASSAIATHSSSVSTRPATRADAGAGAGVSCAGVFVGGAGVGVCAPATPVNTTKTKEAIGVNDAMLRGLDIGTREYHARSAPLKEVARASVDSRWMRGGYLFS